MSDIQPKVVNGDVRENRLLELRKEAEEKGIVRSPGVRANGGPRPVHPRATAETGYYGLPLLKTPAWTWEVPIYFFTGGFAGAASIIGAVGKLTSSDEKLVRDARMLAAVGGTISPALLIADLGMPSRFLHMLRVFKIQSPMSVGSWTLVLFSSSASALAFLDYVKRKSTHRGRYGRYALNVLENAAEFFSVISGALLSTYTGVLIGATAVPVWNANVGILPVHFAASGVGSAASLLELRGNCTPAMNALGMGAAAVETLVGASIELRQDRVLDPLKRGPSGWLTRIGGLLAGPLPLALRVLSLFASGNRQRKLRKAAAVASIAGSVVTRFAWVQAGQASAKDPRIPLQLSE
jgi:formate-dependent nitrite reductase membrane component NrfD